MNNFAISTSELAKGMQNAAATLKTQGNSFEESLALLTAGSVLPEYIEIYIKNTFNCVDYLKSLTTIYKKLIYECLKTRECYNG